VYYVLGQYTFTIQYNIFCKKLIVLPDFQLFPNKLCCSYKLKIQVFFYIFGVPHLATFISFFIIYVIASIAYIHPVYPRPLVREPSVLTLDQASCPPVISYKLQLKVVLFI
jgi:hypothetical protein